DGGIERRYARFSPRGAKSAERAFEQASDRLLARLLATAGPAWTAPEGGVARAADRMIDLHCHSTASDGLLPPARVVEAASAAGLTAIALTDHDTTAGLAAARAAGARLGVRVIGGCEFSVAAPWGEMHLLGYFLEPD